MFKYYNALTNRSGDALRGHLLRLFDANGAAVSIFADPSGTPIVTESGVANAARSGDDGMVRFYVPDGVYEIRYYDQHDVYAGKEVGVPMQIGAAFYPDTATGLAVTEEGQIFWVSALGEIRAYRNEAGVAVPIASGVADATIAAVAAQDAADAAAASQAAARDSEGTALGAAQDAEDARDAAAGSASAAAVSKAAAAASAQDAANIVTSVAGDAAESAANAASASGSATAAQGFAATATAKAGEAAGSASGAANSADTATTAASTAVTKASEANASAVSASGSASSAATSAAAAQAAMATKQNKLVPGAGINIDNANPDAPVISSTLSAPVTSVAGRTGDITLTKTDVGLGNVDNTSDANKPVSTAQQAALNAKANSAITITAGSGLTGGGSLAANRTLALSSTSLASLAKADSAVQPGSLGSIVTVNFPATPVGNVLNDLGNWVPQGGGGGGGGQVNSITQGAGISVNATDPVNPTVSLNAASIASLEKADGAVQPGSLGNSAGLDVGTAAGTVAAGNHTHPAATTGAAGFMSAADKTKLDGIQAGAQVNPGAASTTSDGLMSSADKSKLNGIAAGATKNQTDTYLLDRANHTGTQAISTIADLQVTLEAKEDKSAKGAAGGYASLDAAGKIPSAQIPPVALTEPFVVSSEAAMLALTAQVGDVAIRTDVSKTFMLRVEPATALANWTELLSPAQGVMSVNGQAGPNVVIPAATPAQEGLMAAGDKSKLDGIADGATKNQTDAYLLNLVNATGVLPVARGGTGAQSAIAAANSLNVMSRSGGVMEGKVTTTATTITAGATPITPGSAARNLVRYTNTGPFTVVADSGDGGFTTMMEITNGAGAGDMTPSGFDYADIEAFKPDVGAKFNVLLLSYRPGSRYLYVTKASA